MGFTNGQIPSSALVPISGRDGARLLAGPAASWERVAAECQRRFGWRPAPTGPSDAYRDLATQAATFLARYVPARTGGGYYGDIRWWAGVRYVRKRGTAAAAVPGTSNHGKGRAVDVTGLGGFAGTRYAQLAAVAVPLGWSNAEGRSVDEPWHWVDLASPDTVSSGHATVPGLTPTPGLTAPTPIEEDDMFSDTDRENLNELRRFFGLMAGTVGSANDGEHKLVQRMASLDALEQILVNSAEARRMLGALLGWQPPQGPEADALQRLYGGQPPTVDIDEAALAREIAAAVPADLADAVADELAKRLTR